MAKTLTPFHLPSPARHDQNECLFLSGEKKAWRGEKSDLKMLHEFMGIHQGESFREGICM
jgi:hypothetical protein